MAEVGEFHKKIGMKTIYKEKKQKHVGAVSLVCLAWPPDTYVVSWLKSPSVADASSSVGSRKSLLGELNP